MSKDYSTFKDMTFECVHCEKQIKGAEIEMRGRISCPYCGFRVIRKVRPPIVKRVKAI